MSTAYLFFVLRVIRVCFLRDVIRLNTFEHFPISNQTLSLSYF